MDIKNPTQNNLDNLIEDYAETSDKYCEAFTKKVKYDAFFQNHFDAIIDEKGEDWKSIYTVDRAKAKIAKDYPDESYEAQKAKIEVVQLETEMKKLLIVYYHCREKMKTNTTVDTNAWRTIPMAQRSVEDIENFINSL